MIKLVTAAALLVLVVIVGTKNSNLAFGAEPVTVFYDGTRFVARVIFRASGPMGMTKFYLESAESGRIVDSQDLAVTNVRTGPREDFWYNLPSGTPVGAYTLRVETTIDTGRHELINGSGRLEFKKTGEVHVERKKCRKVYDAKTLGPYGWIEICD